MIPLIISIYDSIMMNLNLTYIGLCYICDRIKAKLKI